MSKIFLLLVAFSLSISLFNTAKVEATRHNISLILNGSPLATDVAPALVAGRVLLPIRAVAESLGSAVVWRADGSIALTKDTREIVLRPGSSYVLVNGARFDLDTEIRLISGRIMVPVRFIGETFGAVVVWDQSRNRVAITTANAQVPAEQRVEIRPGRDRVEIVSTQGQRLYIGMQSELARTILGEPERREPTLHGYEWWVYNSLAKGVLLVGVANNEVVTIYTDSPAWRIAGVSEGASFRELSALHVFRETASFRFQGAEFTISLRNTDINEEPLVIVNEQAVVFYLDTARNRAVSAIRIMNLQTLVTKGNYAMSWQTTEGTRINFGLPVLSDAQRRLIFNGQERIMFDLVNSFRLRNGLNALAQHERLASVAREHSLEMFWSDFFAHFSFRSGSPGDRKRRAGIAFRMSGENISRGARDAIGAHHGLTNSPGHRKSILRPEFTQLGVGIVGKFYTQKFIGQ